MIKGLIPTGGRGTRLRPFTFSTNKHLIPIANKPMILYPVEALVEAGVREIGIVTNETRGEIENLLGSGRKWGAKFTYINQPYPGGLAHVIQVSESFLAGSKFVYHLGDNIFIDGIDYPLRLFLKSGANALAPYLHHENNRRMGVPFFDSQGNLVRYVEKPSNPPHDLAVPGLYFFDAGVFRCFGGHGRIKPSERGELEIGSVYQWLIDNGYRVETCEITGWWRDPGQLGDIIEANRLIMDRKAEFVVCGSRIRHSKLKGKVGVGRDSRIVNSIINGPVLIGEGVEIVNSFLGPYTAIYHNCKVINSSVEESVIMEGTIIENVGGKIDHSFIGREVRILGKVKNHHLIIPDLSQVHL